MSSAETGARSEPFADRRDAGRQLAERLASLAGERVVVVALPRGGVPVAHEVAAALDAPLEILAVRKLGAPHNPEYGIGAVAEDGTCVIDAEAVEVLGISNGELEAIVARESAELVRRVAAYRGDRPPLDLEGRTAVVVDDGVATGVTDTAALRAVRQRGPRRVVLAVPVSSPDALCGCAQRPTRSSACTRHGCCTASASSTAILPGLRRGGVLDLQRRADAAA